MITLKLKCLVLGLCGYLVGAISFVLWNMKCLELPFLGLFSCAYGCRQYASERRKMLHLWRRSWIGHCLSTKEVG